MNRPPDNERLLNDVLTDESPAGFREALLGETLRLARGRRRWRQTRRVGGVLALVAVVAALVWRNLPPRTSNPMLPSTSYQLVRSQPLSVQMIVTTQPVSADQFITSVATAGIVYTTGTSGGFREIGDDELLAIAPEPAALIRRGPHEAELVFVRSADEEPSRQN